MLYFEMQNIRVFTGDTFLEMTPNKTQTKFKDMYVQKSYERKKVDLLPFAVIYGANASGKSTIIKSMQLLREIILSGRVFSDDPHDLLFNFELLPYLHDYNEYVKPLKLSIGFIYGQNKYEYTLSIESTLPAHRFNRKIMYESLYINDKLKFERDDKQIKINGQTRIIGQDEAISPTELYLYGSFKSNVDDNLHFQNIVDWFRNDLVIISNIGNLKISLASKIDSTNESLRFTNSFIEVARKTADFGPQRIFYQTPTSDNIPSKVEMRALYQIDNSEFAIDTSAYNTESSGTIKLVDLSVILLNAILNGSTLIVDELDSSFHFGLIKEIVSLFVNKEINTRGAQLIFTSHNPTFMAITRVRKDQVYFIEKDNNTHTSELYSLADFKSNSENDVRTGENFIKNYLQGKYGALPRFNFEDNIISAIKQIRSAREIDTTATSERNDASDGVNAEKIRATRGTGV